MAAAGVASLSEALQQPPSSNHLHGIQMTNPTPLSPAAQAVKDAAYEAWYTKDEPRSIAAAALRAAADQVVIKLAGFGQESAWYLKEIAIELEGAQ